MDSPNSEQREFDALDLAQAADASKSWDYDQAKQWLANANPILFVESRQANMSGFFRERGYLAILVPKKSETAGRHRAQWFLQVQPLEVHKDEDSLAPAQVVADTDAASTTDRMEELVYEYTGPGELRIGLFGWLLLGRQGNAPTKSARGLMWAVTMASTGLIFLLILLVIWAMSRLQRPVSAADVASLVMMLVAGAVVWRFLARPLIWLLEDRIIPAPELLAAFSEEPCQLEMPKDQNARYIRLVRYGGVCPVCAGQIELRYGVGTEARRLFGACSEAPQEHVFSFDRVTRKGRRVRL